MVPFKAAVNVSNLYQVSLKSGPSIRYLIDGQQFTKLLIPVGSFEWHSLHLPMGTDALIAEAVCYCLAQKVKALVFPPLYIATDDIKPPTQLAGYGVKSAEAVRGMDWPTFGLPSLYFTPATFRSVIMDVVKWGIRAGFKQIFIINGHGSQNQKKILTKLSQQFTTRFRIVRHLFIYTPLGGVGHADLIETSILLYLYPNLVDLTALPRGEDLPIWKYGILNPASERNDLVISSADPRRATVETGRELVTKIVNWVLKEIELSDKI